MNMLPMFLLIFFMKLIDCEWIDPHEMNTNAKEKYMKPTLKKSSSTSSLNNEDTNIDSEICFSHLKRIVSVFMKSAHIDKRDPAIYYGHLRFHIDPDDFDFLMKFGKEDLSFDKLRRLDSFFSQSFQKSSINEYLDQLESFQLKIYSLVVNSNNFWLLGSVCLLYVVYQLFKNNFSFSYIIKYLLILILIWDFGSRYHSLLEEAEEHNASMIYSAKCDPDKMTWGEWTKFWFSNKNCERKIITPLDAFLYQVKNLIIVPMHALGTGMGGFGYNMFTSLPLGLNLIMWPLMLIFVIIVVIFTLVICTGEAIEFNIFHLIKFKIGGSKPVQNENMLTGRAFERLMERFMHRPMVQNISVSVPSGTNRSEITENDNSSAPATGKKVYKVTSDNKSVSSICENTPRTEHEETDFSSGEGNSELKTSIADNIVGNDSTQKNNAELQRKADGQCEDVQNHKT